MDQILHLKFVFDTDNNTRVEVMALFMHVFDLLKSLSSQKLGHSRLFVQLQIFRDC